MRLYLVRLVQFSKMCFYLIASNLDAFSVLFRPAGSSPNLSPLHQQQQRARITSGVHHSHHPPPTRSTKSVLAPSGRWGGSMVASMYGGSAATATATTTARDPLANVHSMTTSFAVGETSGI